ncbi:calcium-binding protein (plasmid) [Shimia sp. W99]
MGALSFVQTIWTSQFLALGQIARIDITGGGSPALVIHDPATSQLGQVTLTASPIQVPDIVVTDVSTSRALQSFSMNGTRGLDSRTLDRLTQGEASASAYLDGVGFYGNKVVLHRTSIDDQDYLFVAPSATSGLFSYRIGSDGGLTPVQILNDTAASYLRATSALTSVSVGADRFLLTASMQENGLSVYRVGPNGQLTQTGAFGFSDRLPIDRPVALTGIEVGTQSFVVMASFGTSSLSVLEIEAGGTLRFVDQVTDAKETRFAGTTALDWIEIGERILIAAAGNDGGVSLFQMLPSGRLLYKESLVAQTNMALNGVSQLRFAIVEGRVELFVLSPGDGGLTRLALDIGTSGVTATGNSGTSGDDILSATADGGEIRGLSGDDILIDGPGQDRLQGGNGADVFVFRPDSNHLDRITDFNLNEDQLDISAYSGVHSLADISVRSTTGGAVLRIGDDEIHLTTHNGTSLTVAQLEPALLLDASHVVMPDPVPRIGDDGDNMFYWGPQPDTIDGGAGYDTMNYAAAPMRSVVNLEDARFNDHAAAGNVLTRIEALIGSNYNDALRGDDTGNTLTGLDGHNTLLGGPGADWLTPGSGSDSVDGGVGMDTVSFVDLAQGASIDLMAGTATSGGDTDTLVNVENITGSIFGDFIRGNASDNHIRGLGDYDWLVGSEGSDTFDGGNGRDMISYVYADAGVTVNLGAGRGTGGQALGDTYASIERVTGSIYNDLFYGSDGEEDFRGLGGYDWFVGSGGGRDRYDGGGGKDTVAYSASSGGVLASLLRGYGSGGDAARDLYTDIENLTGSSHADMLTGDNGRNVLRGLHGEDTLIGNGGVDRLEGGGSNDYLDGGTGWDVAVFGGNRVDYTISIGTTGVTVRHGAGTEGTDTLFNIEALQFVDEWVYL